MDSTQHMNESGLRCDVCHAEIESDLDGIRFSGKFICVNCKFAYFQKLQEGVQVPPRKTGLKAFLRSFMKALMSWAFIVSLPVCIFLLNNAYDWEKHRPVLFCLLPLTVVFAIVV